MCLRYLHINLIAIAALLLGFVHTACCADSKYHPASDASHHFDLSYSDSSPDSWNETNQSVNLLTRQRPFSYALETGLKFRGIQLSDNLYLIDNKMPDKTLNLGLCLATEKILYRFSPNLISVALNY